MTIPETIHWHRVEDGLPDDDASVLVVLATAECGEARHSDDGWRWLSGESVVFAVTHWADLPQGPGGGGE